MGTAGCAPGGLTADLFCRGCCLASSGLIPTLVTVDAASAPVHDPLAPPVGNTSTGSGAGSHRFVIEIAVVDSIRLD